MNFGRTNVNAVVLPTGRILIIGGHSNGQKWSPTPVLQTEIYDPGTEKWTVGAPLNFPRQYHSVCILLADGSVVTAGGVAPGTADPDQHSLELYSPGYLSFGTRPVISTAPPVRNLRQRFCGRDLAGCQYQFGRVDRADLGDPPYRCLTAIHKTPHPLAHSRYR